MQKTWRYSLGPSTIAGVSCTLSLKITCLAFTIGEKAWLELELSPEALLWGRELIELESSRKFKAE